MQPGIDLIVVNYRCSTDLREFCQSVLDHVPSVPYDLWIVNNDPDKADLFLAEHYCEMNENFHSIRLLNVGYAKAINHAMTLGDRETAAFFNADTILGLDTVDGCYRALMDHGDWAVVGPFQKNQANHITAAGIFGTVGSPVDRGWREYNKGQYSDIRDDAVSVSGSAYFVKRHIWELMSDCHLYRDLHPDAEGAFLPTSHYYEDFWYSVHVKYHGYKVAYYGVAKMTHKWHQASPLGGWGDLQEPRSRKTFRAACDHHGIDWEN